jgi:co-chaperonin GroES (HSP10)
VIIPIGDKILVVPIEDNITAGGIYLPGGAETAFERGKVVRVGETIDNIKEGDILMFFAKTSVFFASEGVAMVNLKNVIAVERGE